MHSKSAIILSTGALVLPLACSGGTDGGASGAGTSGPSSGGNAASGGTLGSGGVTLPAGGTSSGSGQSGGEAGASATDAATSVGGTAGGLGDDLLFVPEELPLSKLAGAGESMKLMAFTLLQGPLGSELYAAVRNEGETTACDGAVTFEFFDKAEQSVAAWVGGLYGGQLYRRSDGSGAIIACIDPSELAMIGSMDLPPSVVIDELGYVLYRFTYFDRDILPFEVVRVNTITVSQLESISSGSGSAFRGTLENGLDVAVENPGVTIFPLNSGGRPLGMATNSGLVEIPPGGSWAFETTPVAEPGVNHAVYPRFDLVSNQ